MLRRGALVVAAIALGSAAWIAACSSFEDAAPTSEDAGDGGGNGDGATNDGTALLDAGGPDAADENDGAWVPCRERDAASGTRFCDDFDRGGPVDYLWTGPVTASGGTTTLYDGGLTLPQAFLAHVSAGATTPARAQLKKMSAMPKSLVRASTAVRIDSLPHAPGEAGFSHLLTIEFDNAPCVTSGTTNARAIELSLYPTGSKVVATSKGLAACPDDGGAAQAFIDQFPFTPEQLVDGKFHQIGIEVSHQPCGGSTEPYAMRAWIDTNVVCRPSSVDLFTISKTVQPLVGVFIASGPFAETSHVYDNVTIDTE